MDEKQMIKSKKKNNETSDEDNIIWKYPSASQMFDAMTMLSV